MNASDLPVYDWWGLNQAIFLWVNGFHAPWWDALMLAATHAGSAGKFSYWIGAALLLALLRPAALPLLNVTVFAGGFVATGFLVPALKAAFDLPRPLAALGRDLVTVVGPAEHAATFPSGHAAFVALICVALSPGAPRSVKWVLWVFAAVVGLSRMVVGAHFPADILGGAILGAGAAVVVRLLIQCMQRWLVPVGRSS